MPIGIQRLNAPKPQPSLQIVFIKPLPGPDFAYAQDFLERIAAICHPIMKANHLSIMTLEEHEPNPEFIGRNFNAGEIIQLVLKAPYSGHWLSFRSVQMVMMHELAHCQQMNHGREFWKVNNQFKGELRELWDKGYTGDGLWGRGQTLLSGQYDTVRSVENEVMPANLCGGTFRSRKRKRKRNTGTAANGEETYAKKKARRIAKKFGVNGAALGGDEETRVRLEYGQKIKGKPRVANSARGRELRVAAAAARFGQQKMEESHKEESKVKEESGVDNESETEDEYEEIDEADQAVDLDGSQILDGKGHGMVRVCGDDDQDDAHVKEEMDELQELSDLRPEASAKKASAPPIDDEASSTIRDSTAEPSGPDRHATPSSTDLPISAAIPNSTPDLRTLQHPEGTQSVQQSDLACPICSLSNEASTPLCLACSHVLDTNKITRYWSCLSEACRGSQYINAADCGLCGVCGSRKPTSIPD